MMPESADISTTFRAHVRVVTSGRYQSHWNDGTPTGDDEKAIVLDQVVDSALDRGWAFKIEW